MGVSEGLAHLDYDAYRSLRFKPSQSAWRDAALPFELQFFHAGHRYTATLKLHEIVGGRSRPLVIPRSSFDYGSASAVVPRDGAAEVVGFRVHAPLNKAEYKDEVAVFLGASYFRAVGAGVAYGLSARGLAVDTSGPEAEEFPAFREFWFERPAQAATTLTLYALLDGPRLTGAYRFVIHPGAPTAIEVQARLFARAPVTTLGIAPLTSMFFSGENQRDPDDFRPEVHDSDGLQVHTANGEWIWRPLQNPKQPFATSFVTSGLRGFGLLQRDRAFNSYEDLEAHYERRPGVWIEPVGDWGPGRVELYQFRAPDETHDNVAAYWVPERRLQTGQSMTLSYRMSWGGDELPQPPSSRVVQTLRGHGYHDGPVPPGRLQFQLDFAGSALQRLPADAEVEVVADAGPGGRVVRGIAYRNSVTGGWRASITVDRLEASRPLELRAFLRHGPDTLSETWSYALPPE